MENFFSLVPDTFNILAKLVLFKPQEYLDPGTGSLIIQTIIAGAVGVLFVFRTFWGKLLRTILGKSEEAADEDDDDTE